MEYPKCPSIYEVFMCIVGLMNGYLWQKPLCGYGCHGLIVHVLGWGLWVSPKAHHISKSLEYAGNRYLK